MAISLNTVNNTVNNHASRIKTLESKTTSTIKIQNEIVSTTNLTFIFGSTYMAVDSYKTVTFKTPFTTNCIMVITQGTHTSIGGGLKVTTQTSSSYSRTGFRLNNDCMDQTVYWLAIGYLISYRILNHAYAYIKSLRDFKAVIKSHSFCKLLSKISREVI